jgi:hypothetical protein
LFGARMDALGPRGLLLEELAERRNAGFPLSSALPVHLNLHLHGLYNTT